VQSGSDKRHLLWLTIFAIAFGYVEAAVVVYLRVIYYPGGFAFPLRMVSRSHIAVELAREFATIVMLASVGALAGKTRWGKFACFMIAFGVWDIFFYIWLKAILDWPASILDWDILFLLPLPWIGPVLAPVLISLLMIAAGLMILRHERTAIFTVPLVTWLLAIAGAAIILYSFMSDTAATLRLQMPAPYRYELFAVGLALMVGGLWHSVRQARR
jgi:hypothetical protein